MRHQTTQPPTHKIEEDWPKRILLSLGALILIVAFALIIYAGIKGGPVNNMEDLNDEEGIAVGEPNPNGYDCAQDFYDCGNFTTQSEAQVAFDTCFNEIGEDVWQLDTDQNGIVCEELG